MRGNRDGGLRHPGTSLKMEIVGSGGAGAHGVSMAAVPSTRRASGVEPPAAGEAAATHDLYERYADQVYGFCRHRLGSREEAEDAVQSTFLNAFRGLKRGVVPEAEAAWLFTIARNVCLSRRRSTWRRGRIEAAADFELVQELTPAPAGRGDELMGLQDVLEQMPESQRRAILLREWQGLSYREIAQELELSQGAVETLIFRARRSLAQGLEAPPESKRRRVRRGAIVGDVVAALKSFLVAGSAATKVAATVAVVSGATVAATAPVEHHLAHVHRATPAAPAPRASTPRAPQVTGAPAPAKPATAAAPRETTAAHRSAPGVKPPVVGGKHRRTPVVDGQGPAVGDSLQSQLQDVQPTVAPGESSSAERETQASILPAVEQPSGAEPGRGSDTTSPRQGQDGAAPSSGGEQEASRGDGSAPAVSDQGVASSVAVSPPPDQAPAGEPSPVPAADPGAGTSDSGGGDGGDR